MVATNRLTGHSAGFLSVYTLPPNQAMLGQCYTVAKHMLALKWTVLSGAAIIRKDAWDKISANETTSDKTNIGAKGSFSIEG